MSLQDELLLAQADYDRTTPTTTLDIKDTSAVGQGLQEAATSKLDTLSNARNNKIDSLSQLAAQDVNMLGAEELQYQVGRATDASSQILTRDDGSRYKFAVDPNTGMMATDAQGEWIEQDVSDDVQGRDLYAALTDEDQYKFGLAAEGKGYKGRYNPSIGQYIPGVRGYGWSPGPYGVNPDKDPLMNLTLDYGKATDIEKLVHSNIGQIKERSIGQGPTSIEDEYRFGSGKTEYTKGSAPLWNIDYKDDGKALEAGTAIPGQSRDGLVRDAGGNIIGTAPEAARGFAERTGNTLAAFGSALTKELIVDTVDWVGELTGGWDVGNEKQKSEMVNDWYGYKTKNAEDAQRKVSVASQAIFDENAGILDKAKAVAMGIYEAAKTPELLGQSLGTVFAWMAPGAWLTKGKKLKDAAGVIGKVKHGMKNQAGQITAAVGNVNDQYETFVENNNGVELKGEEKIGWFAERFGVQMFNQNLDAITAISILKSPGLLQAAKDTIGGVAEKSVGKFLAGVGKTMGTTVAQMPKEAAQEYSQRMMELYNETDGSQKFAELDSFMKFMTDEGHIKEATVDAIMGAGGSAQFQALGAAKPGQLLGKAATAVSKAKIDKAQKVAQEGLDASSVTTEADLDVEFEESEVETVERGVVFESANNLKAGSDTVEEYREALEGQKQAGIGSVFDMRQDGSIPALSEEGAKLLKEDPEAFDARVGRLTSWLETEYASEFTKDGEVSPVAQAVVNEVRKANETLVPGLKLKYQEEAGLDPVDVEVAEIITDVVTTNEEFKAKVDAAPDEESKRKVFEDFISPQYENVTVENKEEVVKTVTDIVQRRYETLSGFSFSGDVTVSYDPAQLLQEAQEEAQLKSDTRLAPKDKKTPVVDRHQVTNKILNSILNKGLTADTVQDIGLDESNTKLNNQVIKKLDPSKAGIGTNVSKQLMKVGKGIIKGLKGTKAARVGKVFKGKYAAQQMQRLMVVGMNTINASTVSDTELRRNIDPESVTGDSLQQDQWYAGESRLIEQIGKDYASSLGLRVEGSPEQVLKAHRDMGKLAIEALEASGLIEIEEDMQSVLSDDVLASRDGSDLKVTPKTASKLGFKGVSGKRSVSESDKNDTLLYADRGIRLAGTVDSLAEGSEYQVYENDMGDAIKRLNKLLIPNSVKVPDREPNVDAPLMVDGKLAYEGSSEQAQEAALNSDGTSVSMKLNSKVEAALKKFRALKARLDPRQMVFLKELRKMRDKADGNLNDAIRSNEWLKEVIGIKDTGAYLSKASEDGSNNAKLDAINSILDNLDELEDGFHFNYQVDINNRITLLETVLNFQSDKTFARTMVTANEDFVIEGEKDTNDFVNSIIEELKLIKDATKEKYDTLREDILNGNTDNEVVAKIFKDADILNGNESVQDKMEYFSDLVSEADGYPKFKGKVFKLMMLLNAVNDIKERDDSIVTSYMGENDSRASGVLNTHLNISGREAEGNPQHFEERLAKLGIKLKGGQFNIRDLEDAYSMLSGTVAKYLGGLNTGRKKIVSDMLGELKAIGIDMRELAKPPVMTWFYSAGQTSIIRDLTETIIGEVVDEAAQGNKVALDHIAKILGKESVSTGYVKNIRPNSVDHKKLISAYNKIGKVYSGKLTEAFPVVEEYKKKISELFETLAANSVIGGKDYWLGHIRSAYDSLEENGRSLDHGFTSIYKNRQVLDSLTDDEKEVIQVIYNQKKANLSSALPLQTQNVDAGSMMVSIEEIVESNLPFVMTVHDNIMGQGLDDVKKIYEQAAIDFAVNYDIVDNMLLAMETTRDRMKAELDSVSGDVKGDLEGAIKRLDDMIVEEKAINDKIIQKKKALLDGAEANTFGLNKADTVESVEGSREAGKKEKEKEKAEDVATPFDEPVEKSNEQIVTEKFLGSKRDAQAVQELLDGVAVKYASRIGKFKDDLENVTFAEYDPIEIVRTMKKEAREAGKSVEEIKGDIKAVTEATAPFIMDNVIYLVGDFKYIGTGTISNILDSIAHEVEHAMSNKYITDNIDTAPEVRMLKRALKMMKEPEFKLGNDLASKRLGYVLQQPTDVKMVQELVAVYKGEPRVRDAIIGLMREHSGIKESLLSKSFNRLMAAVRKLITGKSVTEIDAMLDENNEVSIDNIALAAEVVSMRSREKNMAEVDIDDKMAGLNAKYNKCKGI